MADPAFTCSSDHRSAPSPGRHRARQELDDPLPEDVQTLRQGLYPQLAAIANEMMTAMGRPDRYPDTLVVGSILDRSRGVGDARGDRRCGVLL